MTVQKDNHIDPNTKARWGFAGGEGEVTVGPQTVGETGGVDHARTRIEPGGAHNNGGGAESTRQALELEAVNLLAAGLESGVLNPVEGDGAAARLHAALSGIQESMATLAESRDSAVEKSELLQKQVDDLLAQAEQARLADAEANEVAELKAKLDAAKVTYRANASKESLQKQVDELPKA
ncbi:MULTISPECIES: hypothetical protein [Pseudomonas]|uniref:Uncharacterized protein n=1 Tax=Pseudomonas azotoformans TaxID=47878 RepID=A0A4Q0HXU6_PSEAZ|nr:MULTISPECIES: hypothetical protein [Pseudomonas]MBJ2303856.1 hypothetical protein [Pseudomonas sp. MF2846]MBK3492279.1 hypothetical protein [Pseudomonas sp. MF2857]RXE54175.1 hypothetical protein B4O85_04855 [Pseudomonas azotoformans]